MLGTIRTLFTSFLNPGKEILRCELQQSRTNFTKARNMRDMKRRHMTKDYAVDRARWMSLLRAEILPKDLHEDIVKQFPERIPRQTGMMQLTGRCVVTGRGRGNVMRWRLSRFIFRHQCDYNLMAGIQRAMW